MEAASSNALTEIFGPRLVIKFCNFHMMKAVREYFCSKCHLRSLLRDEEWGESIRRWVCSFSNLAYLPMDQVARGFLALSGWISEFLRRHPQASVFRPRLKGELSPLSCSHVESSFVSLILFSILELFSTQLPERCQRGTAGSLPCAKMECVGLASLRLASYKQLQ